GRAHGRHVYSRETEEPVEEYEVKRQACYLHGNRGRRPARISRKTKASLLVGNCDVTGREPGVYIAHGGELPRVDCAAPGLAPSVRRWCSWRKHCKSQNWSTIRTSRCTRV